MNTEDAEQDVFQQQLLGLIASDRARHLARSELASELVQRSLSAQGLSHIVLPDHWKNAITSMMKLGLEDPVLHVLLSTLAKDHLQPEASASSPS